MALTTTGATPCIRVKKLFHRDEEQIGFYFNYDKTIYQHLKTLEGARYSKTFKCIYIPYTKKAFGAFKALGYNYTIVNPSDDQCRTRQSPQKSALSTITQAGPMNEGRKLDTDIHSRQGLEKITWQDNHFFIKIRYSKEQADYLKSLYGGYWYKKQGNWVCKGTHENLLSLQTYYGYWDTDTYSRLEEITKRYSQQSKIIIKSIPHDLSKLELRIMQSEKAVAYVKQISLREYNAGSKSWLIPRDRQIVERFVKQCKAAGCLVRELYSWEAKMPLAKSRNGEKWLKAVLHGVPAEQLEMMQLYAKVFIRENYSFQTMKAYCSAFRRYLYHVQDLQTINDKTRPEIEAYLNQIAAQQVTYQELNRHISALKFYYEKLGGWTKLRFSQINRPKRAKSLPYIFSLSEVKRLFAQIKNPKHRCMLYLAYGCGLRAGEVVSLQVRDVMVDRQQIFIRGSKGKKDRVVMMPKSILPLLQEYMQGDRPDYWLFPGQKRERPYSRSSLRNVFKSAVAKSGLDKRHKLHNLRHSFATHLMESGTQQRLIQKLLGHTNSKTTEIYTHISRGSVTQVESPLDKLDFDEGSKNVKK